jgi:hypothetical protein
MWLLERRSLLRQYKRMAKHPNKHIREAIRYAEDHMVGRSPKQVEGRISSAPCGVLKAIAAVAVSESIRRRAAPKIMRGAYAGRSIDAPI